MAYDNTQTWNGTVLEFKGNYYGADGINGAAVMYANGYNPSIYLNNTAQNNSNMAFPWLAVAGAGASLGGSIASTLINANQSKKAQERQARIQKEQFDYTNEYNLPVNQVKRLIDSGLNPNLLYGSSHPTGNTAGMPQVGSAQPAKVDFQSAIKFSLDAMRLEKENRLLDQQIKNMSEQNRGLAIDNDIKEDTKQWSVESKEYELLRLQNEVTKGETENVILSNKRIKDDYATEVYGQLVDEGLMFDIEASKYYMDQQTYILAKKQESIMIKQLAELGIKINNLAKEGRILEYKAELADSGINPDDPVWARAIGLFINAFMNYFGLGGTVGAIKEGGRQAGKFVDNVRKPVRDLIGK